MSRSVAGQRAAASDAVDCLVILLAGALLALVVRPFQDTPFVDDWVYAWSVQRLLAGDGLLILDWSSHPNFAHVLWGTLFCLPFGFSFVALRVSTWVAALLGLCALHLLLRELGVSRRDARLGVALLGLNPVFFMLAATFMTDVPFVAALLWSSYALIVALKRRSDGWLAAFVVLASIAAAIRVVALVTPIAALLTLLLQSDPWGRRPARLAAAAAPLLFFALLMLWGETATVHVADLTYVVGSPFFRRLYLGRAMLKFPELCLQAILCTAGSLGVALLPLAAATLDRESVRRGLPVLAALVALVLIAAATGVDWPSALAPTFTWTWGELGATESLVAVAPAVPVPGWLAGSVTALGFVSFALVAGLLLRRLSAAEGFLAWSIAGQLGLVAVLWLFYDRYLLAQLPLVIALALATRPVLRRGSMVALVGVLALVSVVGVRDHLAYNAALWRTVDLLRERGVPDEEIDAGYVVDGWLHFARPERAPRGPDGKPIFPWLTDGGGLLPYQVANQPLAGWETIATSPYERWLGRSGELYVLQRKPVR